MTQGCEHLQTVWKWKSDKRYYIARIQQNLFGEWSLFKEWGSLKSRAGRSVFQTYGRYDEAVTEVGLINDRRETRGYRLINSV
jgi:predicted DNA-binding WGR domain protein